ncbi:splicing factor 1 isoform X1 [Nerophis lumbriciformis]|uniref:splicing factor 1 isoform X1 n=1 Tax=Nerophis lumbriciformis TaxID=546530 RepID=UPI002ADF5643|nr:RNA-binding protein 4.1-like isoform X1 [Nerophis lumbriciformis]XP_061816016.1 RNA-binding protein 4.1-like isoform X1 [Nerophis lumbriciformis]XP_061816017.1 RNA-binding protein 4.1-like isoform X1 [Nerophis lumbriciformis]
MVKIFVGNLSPDTTSDELRSLFSQYGKIAECSILKSFGFVHMDSKSEAEEAIRNLHQYQLNGQSMNVELSRGKSRGSTKLHVGNIACSNQELRAKFEEYGVVVECDIVKNYAFVHMERMEDAMEAINQIDNTAFKGKLMSVKLSTSRLRTAPGMGDRSGCYRCGQEGHWSKECPLDQNGYHRNGSEPNSDGYDASRFDGHSRGYQAGFSGAEADYGGGYAPVHGSSRGSGHSSNAAGYRAGTGYENAARYGPHPGYGVSGGSEAAYQSDGSYYGAVPGYPVRRSPYEERDPYGVVDYYGKYRANMYSGYFEEQRAVPAPSSTVSSASAGMRERAPATSINPYQCPPIPSAPVPVPSYHTRDRSPIRRVPAEAEGYPYQGSQMPPGGTPHNKYYL